MAINVKKELGNLNGLICQINVLCNDEELEILRTILTNRIDELDQNHLSTNERDHLEELRSAFSNKYLELKKFQHGSPERKEHYQEAVDLLDDRIDLILH